MVSRSSHMPNRSAMHALVGAGLKPASNKAHISHLNDTLRYSQFSCTVRVGRGLFATRWLPNGLHVRTDHFWFSVLGYSTKLLGGAFAHG